MSDYIVTLDTGIPEYNLGVDYTLSVKSTQYTNLRFDDISSSFNGSTQLFPLRVNGEPYFPLNEQQIIVSVNDVVLNPGVEYQVSGSNIYFPTPPTFGVEFFAIALATTADLTRTINFVIDNGSFDITPGSKGMLNIDVTGEIESWMIVSDTEGTISIDVQKTTYDNYPNGFTSIVGSEFPLLINQRKNKDDSLSTWTTKITAGEILDFRVLACTGIQKCSIFLRIKL